MTPEPPEGPADTVVHTPLERMEECASAGTFMSLIATTEFYNHGVWVVLLVLIIAVAANKAVNALNIGTQLAAAIVAVALVWVLDAWRTRLMLAIVVVFTAIFSVFSYRAVMGNLLFKFTLEPTLPAWLAFLSFLLLLGYVDYQFLRAAWQVSRITDAERTMMRGKAGGAAQGLLQRLFGIPQICAWLGPGRRRIAVLLFFVSTAALCFFVQSVWSSLFTVFPALEYASRDVRAYCAESMLNGCGQLIAIWLALPMIQYPAMLGAELLVVAGARYAARRFTRLSLERLISADPRPAILFLRSFRDDQVRLRKPGGNLFRRMVWVGEPRPTLDHVLLEEGTPHGPVVAIGAPGSTPPFGAARAYVSDAEWRDIVAELSHDAGAVIITIDETEGVRWELQHILGQDHVRKTLFLVPPRLMPADALSRSLPLAFADWGGSADWVAAICRIARDEQRLCVGWFWRDDGRIEVLTTRRDSYLAYALAVRIFLGRSSGPAPTQPAVAAPPDVPVPLHAVPPPIPDVPVPHDQVSPPPAILPAPAPAAALPPPPPPAALLPRPAALPPLTPAPRIPLLGAGIMIALSVLGAFLLLVGVPSAAVILLPALLTIVALWSLSRTAVPRVLIPTLGLTIGHTLWGAIGLIVLIVSANVGEQFWTLLATIAIFVALIAWVINARSRGSTIALLVFQILNLAGMLVSLAAGDSMMSAMLPSAVAHTALFTLEAATAAYAIVRLKGHVARKPAGE